MRNTRGTDREVKCYYTVARGKRPTKDQIKVEYFRNQKTSACEIKEGTIYKSNAALCDLKEEDINEIPPPSSKPENNAMCLEDATEYTQIYFDIEATGLSKF